MTERPLDIHLVAIGGTGMAPLACLLQEQGHRVRGSDGPLYPPMSDLLASHGIEPCVGFDPANLDPEPDLVVMGNAVPRQNPEALSAEERGLEIVSMPQALSRFFLRQRRPLVVAGTHGKTTTTSMAAWVYTACETDPSFLVGGVPENLGDSFHVGRGERFIIEGDEYNAAYFDRGPKFLHYRPHTAILTSVEYDHADLYPDPETLLATYRKLAEIMPEDGLLVACGDSREVRETAAAARCRVVFYGLGEDNEIRPAAQPEAGAEGTRFRIADPEAGDVEILLPAPGRHNLSNALAVWAVARFDGLPAQAIADAFSRFEGVKRRLEVVGSAAGVTVVDDFAHHPTAIRETVGGLRQRFPGRRLGILFEPRSLTAGRRLFHDAYVEALSGADLVFFAPIFHAHRLSDEDRLDLPAVAAELTPRGVHTEICQSVDDLLERVLAGARPGDVYATMSSGDFARLPTRLYAALGAKVAPAQTSL